MRSDFAVMQKPTLTQPRPNIKFNGKLIHNVNLSISLQWGEKLQFWTRIENVDVGSMQI